MAINKNKLAAAVARRESGAKRIGIAQVKEVIRLTFEELAREEASDILKLLGK